MAGTNKREQEPAQGQAAQDRGERIETGKRIARGGKATGKVPGAEPQPAPAPPGLSDREPGGEGSPGPAGE